MNTYQYQSTEKQAHGESKEAFTVAEKRKAAGASPPPPLPPPPSPPSSSSSSSSPAHEFSFTVSLSSSSSSKLLSQSDKTKSQSPLTVDLSPADDIFFHGHLLPLSLLSHHPVPPRSSTNSLDSFTLPVKDLLQLKETTCSNKEDINTNDKNNFSVTGNNGRSKQKPFYLFNLSKWRRGFEPKEPKKENRKKNLRLNLSRLLTRYVRMVKPVVLLFRGGKDSKQLRREAYCSYSGNLSSRNYDKKYSRGSKGEFSAPVSRRTSPSNSGFLVATTSLTSNTSDSTMEELQAAIQAAIAHCKNSFAVEEKCK